MPPGCGPRPRKALPPWRIGGGASFGRLSRPCARRRGISGRRPRGPPGPALTGPPAWHGRPLWLLHELLETRGRGGRMSAGASARVWPDPACSGALSGGRPSWPTAGPPQLAPCRRSCTGTPSSCEPPSAEPGRPPSGRGPRSASPSWCGPGSTRAKPRFGCPMCTTAFGCSVAASRPGASGCSTAGWLSRRRPLPSCTAGTVASGLRPSCGAPPRAPPSVAAPC